MNDDSMNGHLFNMSVIDDFLSSELRTVPIVDDETCTIRRGPSGKEVRQLTGDKTLSSFVTIPEVINSTVVETGVVGPSNIIAINNGYCFANEEMSVGSNTIDFSKTNEYQYSTTMLPSITVDSQSPPVVSYAESTFHQNMNSISSQFEFSQQMEHLHPSILEHDINVSCSTSDYSTTNACEHSTTKQPSITGKSQSPSMITYSSLSQPVIDQLKEFTSQHTINNIPPQFEFIQHNMHYASIIEHEINNWTRPQPWLSEPSIMTNESLYGTVPTDLKNTLPSSSSSVVQIDDSKKHYSTPRPTVEEPFECDVCHRKFTHKGNLAKHYLIHTDVKPFECRKCGWKHKYAGNLNKHKCIDSLHQVPTDLKNTLPSSSLSIVQTNSLSNNACYDEQSGDTANPHRLVPGTSLVTGVGVDSSETINSVGQQNTNFVEKLIKYNETDGNRTLRRQQSSEKHHILDTANKQLECNICQKTYTAEYTLRRHYLIHTGEKAVECNICHKRFRRKDELKQHYSAHRPTVEDPFECDVCHRKFTHKGNLAMHYLIHTDVKPFECRGCGWKYKYAGNLNKHKCI